MTFLKFPNSIKSFLLISLIVVLFSSCSKDEVNPDYVGTWIAVESSTEDGITTQYKDIMTFSKGGFTDLGQIYDPTSSKYIDFTKFNGTISVSGSIMTVKITEIGVTTFDMINGVPTGTIVMCKEGSTQYENLFKQSGQPKIFTSDFSVSGNKLTLKTDNNDDGDYTDADETTVYTKQ